MLKLTDHPAFIAAKAYWFVLKPLLWLLLCVVLFIGGCNHGKKDAQAELKAYKERVYAAALVAKAAAHASEKAQKTAYANIAKIHKKELEDAKQTERDVADGIRAGVVSLRKHWNCNLPKTAGSSEEPDEDAGLRAASAGRIVGIGAEADAQVRGLQATVTACQARVE